MPLPEPFARGLRRAGWLAGLPALALVWAGAALYAAPTIAARIEAEGIPVVAGTAGAVGEPWLRLEARGRDLRAAGEAPDVGERESVLGQLAALHGPRRIVSAIGLVETASPFLWAALRTGSGGVALEGSRPVEIGRRALEVRVTGALGPGTRLDDTARAARGAPPDFARAAAFLVARLSGLAAGGRAALNDTVLSLSGEALDVAAYDALRAALAEPPVGFSVGRIEILPPAVAEYRFSVVKSTAGIRLDGFVASEALREAARGAAAEAATGGFVDDRLHAARGLDAAIDPGDLVAFAFRLAGLIQSGTVAFADGAVSVTGDAIDAQAIPEAGALMRDGRPAGVRAGTAALVQKPLAPYRVAIRRTADAVTLTGHLPDAGTRDRVLGALRPRLFREPVVDRTRLADGAPPDLAAAVAAAVPMLASLASGTVAVSDRALTLTGESLYRESAARAPETLAAALPPGWSGHAVVAPRQPAERRDPDACRADFSAATAGADLRFPVGSAVLAPAFYPTLDALAALAGACPALRIAVSGPADPAKPKGTGSGAASGTQAEALTPAAGPDHAAGAGAQPGTAQNRSAPTGAGRAEAAAGKSGPAKADAGKSAPKPEAAGKPDGRGKREPPKKDASDELPPDLPRLRTQALVDYLLQAGARPEQVSAAPDGQAGRVAFALLP